MKKKWEAIRVGLCWITALAKDIPQTNPWKLWMVLYMAKKKKKKTVQAWLRILRWWDYPELSKYNHIYFIRSRGDLTQTEEGNLTTAAEIGGCSHKPINPGGPQKLEEVRHAFSLEPPEAHSPANTLFQSALLIWDFRPLWL